MKLRNILGAAAIAVAPGRRRRKLPATTTASPTAPAQSAATVAGWSSAPSPGYWSAIGQCRTQSDIKEGQVSGKPAVDPTKTNKKSK